MKRPPFCPTKGCPNHRKTGKPAHWASPAGSYPVKSGKRYKQFRCSSCGRKFSERIFSLDFYTHKHISYQAVLFGVTSGAGIRELARYLKVSPGTILNRIDRIGRQAILLQAELFTSLRLQEDLAADGLISFCSSQYYPCDITCLTGTESQVVYALTYANLRRRGVMTDRQKERRHELEQQYCPHPRELNVRFNSLLDNMLYLFSDMKGPTLRLVTDEHKVYTRCMKSHPCVNELIRSGRLYHQQVNSRLPRTKTNPLFAANYIDREVRRMSGDHVRETVKHARNASNLMMRMWVRMLYHNFMKPYRVADPDMKLISHAEAAGMGKKAVENEVSTVFSKRRFLSHSYRAWLDVRSFVKGWQTPLQLTVDYVPKYALN